jgi:hypothetical protein
LPPEGQNPTSINKNGRPNEIIFISNECFKLLCMRSGTEKSNEVRSYYLYLEKLVDDYKNVIIEEMQKELNLKNKEIMNKNDTIKKKNKEIKVLYKDLKNEDYPIGGHIYVFKDNL